MSTLITSKVQTSNVWLEGTGNNSLNYNGSNSVSIIVAGSNAITINSTSIGHLLPSNFTSIVVSNSTSNVTINIPLTTDSSNGNLLAANGSWTSYANSIEYSTGTIRKPLSPDNIWAAANLVTLTDAATIAVDLKTGINFTVTLAGNRTLGNPTNTKIGQTGIIQVLQDATGSRTLAYSSNWKFASGSAPILTTNASARDLLSFFVINNTTIFISSIKDVK